jgi:uncharacterized protein (TIGR02246 family)
MSDDEKEIRGVIDRWMAATRAGNIDDVLSLMTDDVVFLVAGVPPFGKREFRENSAQHADKSLEFDGTSEVIEIKVIGDHAYVINKLSVVTRQSEREQMSRSGYTLTIFRKDNGEWLLARDANLLTPDKQ